MLEYVAVAAVFLSAICLIDLAFSSRYCLYAREALVCTAGFLLLLVVGWAIRKGGLLSDEVVRTGTFVSGLILFVILVEIVWIHAIYHRSIEKGDSS